MTTPSLMLATGQADSRAARTGGRRRLTVMEWRLRQLRLDHTVLTGVRTAALEFGLPAELIASVLLDEQLRLDAFDLVQDRLVRLGVRLPARASTAFLRLLGALSGRSAESFSLGPAQMKFSTLRLLGELGYLEVPATLEAQRLLLLDRLQAPRLVAACLRATAEHWAERGVPILHRPEILGTLYSLGLTGRRGVHLRPQTSERGALIARHAAWLAGHGQDTPGLVND